ncbi:MAG: hypothetical protein BHV63_04655 [Alistipes sp. 56_11]|nr:MAG: hypothetical protein BHV63_04655 [Alistipes sp. 56_11]
MPANGTEADRGTTYRDVPDYAKITNDKIKRDMKNSQARNRQQLPDGGVNRKPMLLARFYSNE